MAEAELSTVARPYARAAFSFALDQDGGLAHWSRMLQLLSAAVNESIVQAALDDPLLTMDDKTSFLFDLMGDDLSDQGRNFIGVLAEYDRLALIATVAEQFEVLKANHEKTLDVSVTSAYEVSEEDQQRLSDALSGKLQRDINMETDVDESLIGGVLIRAEDTVIDDTVRGRLTRLAQALG
ncbi:MAG TPA: F0F1 ATP synthase subunit delta [Gammaproteobacteria bacterium]|nr:F0F1 ATP synthase subunit delta [Gammaproteobacteria bacterium]|tara:strand:+ start:592 stop:1134 length:543 start_codon:yes stop_codon:yes gene_type:complete